MIALGPPAEKVECSDGNMCLKLSVSKFVLNGCSKQGGGADDLSIFECDQILHGDSPALELPDTNLQLELPLIMSRLFCPRLDKKCNAVLTALGLNLGVSVITLRPVMTWLDAYTRWGIWGFEAKEHSMSMCRKLEEHEHQEYQHAYAALKLAEESLLALATPPTKEEKAAAKAADKDAAKPKTKTELDEEVKKHKEILDKLEVKMKSMMKGF